jgi:hypothetical protein
MAAGLGFKDFVTGEVLTAADVDGYLMQGVWVFADAAARTAAVTSPQEGNVSFLKDTNSTEYYSGSAWVPIAGSAGADAINPNLVINGNFTINQRSYVSAANLASGAYGFDRWKSNFTNTTLTYTSAPAGQSVTINSGGGLQQIVEQANVPAGTYVLSFSGTATGRIYNVGATPPSYAASPISFTADGLANVTVEFTATGATKTLSKVKLELGTSATSFSYAGNTIQGELAACQRYYYRVSGANNSIVGTGIAASTTLSSQFVQHKSTLRAVATAVDYSSLDIGDTVTGYAVTNLVLNTLNTNVTNLTITVASGLTQYRPYSLQLAGASGFLGLSAEL